MPSSERPETNLSETESQDSILHTYIPTLNGLAASKNQTGAKGDAYVPTP